jgi:hypothetical protein
MMDTTPKTFASSVVQEMIDAAVASERERCARRIEAYAYKVAAMASSPPRWSCATLKARASATGGSGGKESPSPHRQRGGGVSARFSAASAFARQSPALPQRSISWVSGSHPIGLLSSTASSSSKNQPAR